MPSNEAARRSIAIGFLSVFIDILGVSLLLPVIPFLALELNASDVEIAVIFASYAGAQMLSTPLSGKLSDRFGRKPMLLLSLAGSCGGFLFQGLVRSVPSFIAARFVAGAFGGSIPVVQAYIADVVPPERRSSYFAGLGSILLLAFMFGPGIGSGLSQFSLQTPMFVASAISLGGLVLAVFLFEEAKPAGAGRADAGGAKEPLSPRALEGAATKVEKASPAPADARTHWRLVGLMWAVSFLSMFSFSAWIYASGLFFLQTYEWGTLETGFLTMGAAVAGIFAQLVVLPKLIKRVGRHAACIFGCLVLGLGCFGLAWQGDEPAAARGLPVTVVSVLFIAVGNAFASTSVTSVLSRYASPKTQGLILGTSQSLQALARTIGPLLWVPSLSVWTPLPWVVAACIAGVGAGVALLVLHLNRRLIKTPAAPALAGADQASVATDDAEAATQPDAAPTRACADTEPDADDLQGLSRDELEAEVRRLREQVALLSGGPFGLGTPRMPGVDGGAAEDGDSDLHEDCLMCVGRANGGV